MIKKHVLMEEWAKEVSEAKAKGVPLKADFNLAVNIAVNALSHKKNRDGSPYIYHPLEVAFDSTRSDKKHIVGVLHDVVEDSDWTLGSVLIN